MLLHEHKVPGRIEKPPQKRRALHPHLVRPLQISGRRRANLRLVAALVSIEQPQYRPFQPGRNPRLQPQPLERFRQHLPETGEAWPSRDLIQGQTALHALLKLLVLHLSHRRQKLYDLLKADAN